MKKKGSTYLIMMVALTLLMLVFGGLAHGQTEEGTAVPESTPLQTPAGTIESKLEEASSLLETPQTESDTSEQGGLLDGTVPTRTPVPTATPSAVQEVVSDIAGMIGLDEITFLGLSGDNWIDLFISLLMVVGGYFLGTWMIHRLLPRLARRTATEF